MRRRTRREQLDERAWDLGIIVERSNLGDGRTRFTFTIRDPRPEGHLATYELGHAAGIREAEAWIEGAQEMFDLLRYDVPKGTERGRWWDETLRALQGEA